MCLHVHLGAHKTASTHLQQCLAQARPRLRRHGLRYFGPRGLRAAPALTAALPPGPDDEAAALWRGRIEGWFADAGRVVLSEENIIGTTAPDLLFGAGNLIYPQAPARLARLLALAGGREATLFLAVRNPADFLTSAFGMHLNRGSLPILKEYIGDFDLLALDWAGLARRLLAVAGVGRMVVWAYEDYGPLRQQILAAMVGADNAGGVPDRAPAMRGWSQAAFLRYREAYLHAGRGADLRRLAREAKAALPKGAGQPPMRPFDAGMMDAAARAYRRDLARLRGLARVTLLSADSPPSSPPAPGVGGHSGTEQS